MLCWTFDDSTWKILQYVSIKNIVKTESDSNQQLKYGFIKVCEANKTLPESRKLCPHICQLGRYIITRRLCPHYPRVSQGFILSHAHSIHNFWVEVTQKEGLHFLMTSVIPQNMNIGWMISSKIIWVFYYIQMPDWSEICEGKNPLLRWRRKKMTPNTCWKSAEMFQHCQRWASSWDNLFLWNLNEGGLH